MLPWFLEWAAMEHGVMPGTLAGGACGRLWAIATQVTTLQAFQAYLLLTSRGQPCLHVC